MAGARGGKRVPQQQLLRNAKALLGCTWDQLAQRFGIHPRALKTYRMPPESQDYRALPAVARAALCAAVDHQRAVARSQPSPAPRRAINLLKRARPVSRSNP